MSEFRHSNYRIAPVVVALLLISGGLAYHFSSPNKRMPVGNAPTAAKVPESNASQSENFVMHGALSSASEDGTHFFDRSEARRFIASLAPELQRYAIGLNSRAILPLPDQNENVLATIKNKELATIYLQFHDHPTDEQRNELEKLGVKLNQYMDAYAWSAQGSGGAFEKAVALPFVRAAALIDPRDKLSLAVFAGKVPDYAKTADGKTRLMLLTQPNTTPDQFAKEIAAAGLKLQIVPQNPSVLGPRFEVADAIEAAPKIAALNSVRFVSFTTPPAASRDATTDNESNVTDVRDNAPNLDGTNVKVAIREIGTPSAHVDYSSRFTEVDTPNTGTLDDDHATAVVGQIGSSGASQPSAKGVAPAVQMTGYVLSTASGSQETFAVTDMNDAATKGIRITNHSYGPTGLSAFGDYDPISADWDNAMRANNQIGCFAGNEETGGLYKHIDFFVGAKNTICVAASNANAHAEDATPPTPKSDGIASFSEFGPMQDGRVKPDLVAFGDGVTVDQGTNSTRTASGTSFSTPAVTGMAALAFQRYRDVVGSEPSAPLLKALLCQSATDLGSTGPDATYGFGIANVEGAVNLINLVQTGPSAFKEDTLSNGDVRTYNLDVQGLPTLKMTLCWFDVAGNPSASKALVNDLDLEAQAPNGTIFYPFSLDPANPGNAATATGANHVDPIEQIIVANPQSGVWTIRVKATSIPSGTQSFALCMDRPIQTNTAPLTAIAIASSTEGEAPLTVGFSGALSTGNITSYTWNFGDGSSSQGSTVTHTYVEAGVYTASLTVTDASGQSATSNTITINVGLNTIPSFPEKARLNMKFSTKDQLQFSIVANDPEHKPGTIWPRTRQQARDATLNGEFEGMTYQIILNGKPLLLSTGSAKFILDRRATYKDFLLNVKLNLARGEIAVKIKGIALGDYLGITPATVTPQIPMDVELRGEGATYTATFSLNYISNGTRGTGKFP